MVQIRNHGFEPLFRQLRLSQDIDFVHQLGDGQLGNRTGVSFVHVVAEIPEVGQTPRLSSKMALRLGGILAFEKEETAETGPFEI